jgi:hypothetical protein
VIHQLRVYRVIGAAGLTLAMLLTHPNMKAGVRDALKGKLLKDSWLADAAPTPPANPPEQAWTNPLDMTSSAGHEEAPSSVQLGGTKCG